MDQENYLIENIEIFHPVPEIPKDASETRHGGHVRRTTCNNRIRKFASRPWMSLI